MRSFHGGFRYTGFHGWWLAPTEAHRRDELGGGGGAKNGCGGAELSDGEDRGNRGENNKVESTWMFCLLFLFIVLVLFYLLFFCLIFSSALIKSKNKMGL